MSLEVLKVKIFPRSNYNETFSMILEKCLYRNIQEDSSVHLWYVEYCDEAIEHVYNSNSSTLTPQYIPSVIVFSAIKKRCLFYFSRD